MHLEFVVLGPPISNQQSSSQGKVNLSTWRAAVRAEAKSRWTRPLLEEELKVVVINFYSDSRPSLDLDNMSKPILDAMEGVVYRNDRQVMQIELAHRRIDTPHSIPRVAKVLVDSLQADQPFVYVRIEDPVEPFPLPK